MRQVQLQQNLFADAGDVVAAMHPDSLRFRIYIAQIQDQFRQWSYSYDNAVIYANGLQEVGAKDCYVSANGYGWNTPGRTVSSVGSINSFYVDVDYYTTTYKNLQPPELVELILRENPWLPVPTFFIDSGKGLWLFWIFKQSLTTKSKNPNVDWLAQWQTQQDFLIGKLRKYGADPACSDAARVVRLANTINSKTNRKAMAWETGQRYLFVELKKVFNAECLKEKPTRLSAKSTQFPAAPKTTSRANRSTVCRLFNWHNWHSLAHARMGDLKTLADLRGGKHTDHRRRVIFTYAVEAAHFCRTEERLRAEVEQFIQDFIHEPEKYLKVPYTAVIKRFNAVNELIASGIDRREAQETLDAKNKGRYKHKRVTIVEKLDITPEEGRELKALFSNEEKQCRQTRAKNAKRRQQGVIPRSDYEGKTGDKAQLKLEAKKLYTKLQSMRKVAEEMKLPLTTVRRYIHT